MSDSKNNVVQLTNLFDGMTDLVAGLFHTDNLKAFALSTYILIQKICPKFKELKEEENDQIQRYYQMYGSMNFKRDEILFSFNESFLNSLYNLKEVEVEVSPELVNIYLSVIVSVLVESSDFEHTIILNPSTNNGSLISMIASLPSVDSSFIYGIEDRPIYKRLTENLGALMNLSYQVQSNLPSLSFRSDIIVSDPFLRNVEDILVFFEDYHEYLNNEGFFIVSLMNEFVRSRVFSDMLEKYGYVLIGIIEYPQDLLEGIIDNSIVILEAKDDKNLEFFHLQMALVKNVDGNFQKIKEIKKYLREYREGSKNENHVC